MGKFKNFIESDMQSGMISQDFSSMNLQDRMAQGREIGEPFIRSQLAMHGIQIEPAKGYHQDAKLKIDGFWNGEPVQIKLRRSSRGDSNDIAYEVLRNHDDSVPLIDQLQNENQQGRDWKGQVKHYFVMNREETEIYHVSAKGLKAAVERAIQEMGGTLNTPFLSRSGVDLRPTRDPDPESFTPFKVMAFVPVQLVVDQKFPIDHSQPVQPTVGGDVETPNTPVRKGPQMNPNWIAAVDQALTTGQSSFPAPNNKKLIKPFQKFAAKKGVAVTLQGNQVVLKKAA